MRKKRVRADGMSLLDKFAAVALGAYRWEKMTIEFRPQLASFCYDIAEALIAERERRSRIGAEKPSPSKEGPAE